MASKGILQPEKMPPTNSAAYYHGLRAHLQIITWKLLDTTDFYLKPEDWGCQVKNGSLIPVMTDKEVAPECLLQVVRCKCKSSENQCNSNRCSCMKYGLRCVQTCGECHGQDCHNKEVSDMHCIFTLQLPNKKP